MRYDMRRLAINQLQERCKLICRQELELIYTERPGSGKHGHVKIGRETSRRHEAACRQ